MPTLGGVLNWSSSLPGRSPQKNCHPKVANILSAFGCSYSKYIYSASNAPIFRGYGTADNHAKAFSSLSECIYDFTSQGSIKVH